MHKNISTPHQRKDDCIDIQSRERCIRTNRNHTYNVRAVNSLIDNKSDLLASAIGSSQALIITTPTVNRLFTDHIRRQLCRSGVNVRVLVLHCDELTKDIHRVEHICQFAKKMNLGRTDILISIGGGVISDLGTVAASWLRRGIRHFRVPTTLIGLIDAGIGIKGSLNFNGKKSYLGCFYAPEEVFIDVSFLSTLSTYHLRGGFAEILKIAFVRDLKLFILLEKYAHRLLQTKFQDDDYCSNEVIWRSIIGMLDELEPNLFENRTYERLVDFGHTFSPLLEAAADFSIHHGEAVAIDMALSTVIAFEKELIGENTRDRLLESLLNLGLPLYSPLLDVDRCRLSISDASSHRGGQPNLVVPAGIGTGCFVTSHSVLTNSLFDSALQYLQRKSQLTTHRVAAHA